MIKNYLKIALRNLWRNKGFSFINITGLAVGLACCILILLFIIDETSYDKHHKEAEDIYRLGTEFKSAKGVEALPISGAPYAFKLKNDFPEVEQSTRLMKLSEKNILSTEVNGQRKSFFENKGLFADSTFFRIFSYSFKYGNVETALQSPNSIVISKEIALKLFGNINPIDKIVRVTSRNGSIDFRVSAVFNQQHASHIEAPYFMSMNNNDVGVWVASLTNWATNNLFYTYIKLRHGTDQKIFTKKLTDFVDKHAAEDMKAAGFSKTLFLQSVPDIHLRSDLKFDIGTNGNLRFLYILGSVAVFLLLIACVNFMNLSTARSARRAREVGIRKVIGAVKASLIRQFLGESLLISFISLFVAVLLVFLFLPFFNQVTDKHLQLTKDPSILIWFLIITIFTGLLAGIYPSFYLSSFNPLKVLKGIIQNQLSASFIRKGLVVFQFVISICLILGTIIIWQQMNFIKNQDIGFNKNQQLVVPLQTPEALQTYQVLKNQISKNQDVVSVSGSSTYPGITSVNDMSYYAEGKNVKDAVHVRWNYVDFGWLETLGFKVIKGRGFSRDFLADTANGIVLNEKAVQELGYDVNTAVGKKIYFDWEGQTYFSQIIGIVKDFNFESLHSTISPFGFTMQFKPGFNFIIANIKTARLPELLTALENEWKAVNAETPFEYSFLDEDFQRNYISDERLTRLITYFAFITIFVACLGLFALAAYTAEKRTKEIGIRKVLGATIPGIISLLSKDFIKLVLIAALIAFPIAWWGMNRWLLDFAYRIDISWWVFILAAAVASLIALFTVSFQAIKAAVANPVKSLRTE